MDFQKGEVVYHKATGKKCVVKGFDVDGTVRVTTQDDETRIYQPEELWTEKEWEEENVNVVVG